MKKLLTYFKEQVGVKLILVVQLLVVAFALAAALCVGRQEGMPLMRLAAFCNSAGTLVITRRGAIGLALPTREQVEALAASEACRVTCLPLDSMP